MKIRGLKGVGITRGKGRREREGKEERREHGKDCRDLHNLSSTGVRITRGYIFRKKKYQDGWHWPERGKKLVATRVETILSSLPALRGAEEPGLQREIDRAPAAVSFFRSPLRFFKYYEVRNL